MCTGSEKAFAAGADIKEMLPRSYVDCYSGNLFSNWMEIAKLSKPVREVSLQFPHELKSLLTSDYCCCVWLCLGRRLRVGNDLRHDHRC